MEELQKLILTQGEVVNEEIIKVDSFINHQVDPTLMEKVGKKFAEQFKDRKITKVATIESSGIAPALMTAKELDVPLIILKKEPSRYLNSNLYQTEVYSFTHQKNYELTVSQKYISENDHILLIDDFLADGEAAIGAIRLFHKAHATVAGVGVLINKEFQPGEKKLNEQGIDVVSLVKIKSLKDKTIVFD
ncbi:xanthine phosphoribosyltransferase [Lachnobacterium bovis]|uniref:Xanthine phosphoribosyltransferase n=1 Tax=Lachnobacterium bovis TaxID=140626 RepID=A0A1H9Q0A7_9FIRM|nr:xanthine phosphoribosyltransferase [Lachnobacterium bovis]SER53850.1 xanthine phosphoribosyltransferase [Lachnobacterium bovis]